MTEIKFHTGLVVPERVVTTFNEFAHQGFTPNWLSSLPAVIEALCAKWQIELEPIIGDTWITVVVFGTSPDLGPVVMKSSPNPVDFVAQARAFEIGAGDTVPRLYDLDLEHSTMVMERIVPGTELRHVAMDDEVSTRIGAETLRTFWRPVSDGEGLIPQRRVMQPLFDWTPQPELIDTSLVAQAQQLAASLLERSTQACLVHGDFHHWNVLQRTSGEWVIIDPVGIVGDPASDIARWMHNPPEIAVREDFLDMAARRIRIWADVTGIDADELASWALVGNVLNAINCTAFAPEVMLYFLPRWVIDDALILNWRVHRAMFDQLVSLYLADDLDQYVSSTGSYRVQPAYPGPPTPFPTPAPTSAPYPGPGYIAPGDVPARLTATVETPPAGISVARRLGYITLMQRVGVITLGDERRNYPGPHRQIVFLLTAGQHIRQLIWAKEPLGVGQEAVDPTRCRRLEANWYFCSWYSPPDD